MILLSAGKAKAEVNSFGAELTSLTTDGNPIIWKRDDIIWPRTAPVLFPIVGRLKDDTFRYGENQFQLSQHGFARDSEFEVVEQTTSSVTFKLSSEGMDKDKYPFGFQLFICFELSDNELLIRHKVVSIPNEKLYFSIGVHPAFHIDGPISDYFLSFNSSFEQTRHYLTSGLLNGTTQQLGNSDSMDLTEELFKDDALIFIQPSCTEISLKHKKTSSHVKVSSENMTALGIWKKPNAPFLCIEPWWGWTDNSNFEDDFSNKPGIHFLEDGNAREFTYSVAW